MPLARVVQILGRHETAVCALCGAQIVRHPPSILFLSMGYTCSLSPSRFSFIFHFIVFQLVAQKNCGPNLRPGPSNFIPIDMTNLLVGCILYFIHGSRCCRVFPWSNLPIRRPQF
jgi:hypothetical protein